MESNWPWEHSVDGRVYRHEPSPGHLYRCIKLSDRSKKYFAKYNDINLPGRRSRTFWGPLEKCQEECMRHFANLKEQQDG